MAAEQSSSSSSSSSSRNEIHNWVDATEMYFDAISELAAPVFGIGIPQVKGLIQKPSSGDNIDLGLIQKPSSGDNIDLVIPVGAVNRFKKLKGKPADLAEGFCTEMTKANENKLILEIGSNKMGFVTFKVDKSFVVQKVLSQIYKEKESYGTSTIGEGKSVVVEYSSPNIAKPFHAGHLRSTIIGNFLKNVHVALGYKVISINYLGDWGKQYGLLAVGFEKYGSDEQLQLDPIKHLFDVYVQINKEAEADPTLHDNAREYFKKMEEGDEEALKIWKKFRNLSIDKYKQIYDRLGVQYDEYSGESQFQEEMKEVLKMLEEKNLLEQSEGATCINLKKFKLGVSLVKKKDGSTLYITRDIAAALSRFQKYNFDEMYYVVAAAQTHHFKQLFKILDLMGFEWAKKCKHVDFGLVKGMSTRKGNVVFLENILDEARDFNLDIMKKNEKKFNEMKNPVEISDVVGLSAVIVQDVRAKRIKDYEFNWDRMLAEHGDTGPYLQYAHVRMSSIERKCKEANIPLTDDVDFSLLSEPDAQELAYLLSDYQIVINQAKATLEPSCIITYAMKITRLFSSCVDHLKVKGSEDNVAKARMLLFWATRQVLASSLKMLGLKPLERM